MAKGWPKGKPRKGAIMVEEEKREPVGVELPEISRVEGFKEAILQAERESGELVQKMNGLLRDAMKEAIDGAHTGNLNQAIFSLTTAHLWLGKSVKH